MTTPMSALVASPGEPVQCRRMTADIAVHWYPPGAVPGDSCMCGAITMSEPS